MPRMGVSKEVRELCYKNRDTYDEVHNQPRNICHHIDGNHDNNDPENLIWLSDWEHRSYHSSHRSAETLKKIGDANRMRPVGKETREKHSTYWKEHNPNANGMSDTHRKKLSERKKGRKWFNNGITSVQAYECPDGFKPGRLKFKRKRIRISDPLFILSSL